MPVNSPIAGDTRSRLADWLEVRCLATSRGVGTRSELLGLFDLLGDSAHRAEFEIESGEELELEILEEPRLDVADDVFEEIEYRSRVLRENYPFRVDVRGADWRILRAANIDQSAPFGARETYLFCLLVSAIRQNLVSGVGVGALMGTMPNYFQIVATQAAASLLRGRAISFGWPRPNGQAFRPALDDVVRSLGLGSALLDVPLWSGGREKDAGIDVIAWREFADERPGKLILFGQVASGGNWKEKTVKSDVTGFLSWFSVRPTEHFIPAMFIPFPQHHECQTRSSEAFEQVANAEAWRREMEFGLVIDRLRIVEAISMRDRGLAFRDADSHSLDGIRPWVEAALSEARAA